MFGNKVLRPLMRYSCAYLIDEFGWSIGAHTYGHPTVLEGGYADLRIGNFCSIGPNVTLILGNHRTDLVTTYPFTTLAHFWPEAAASGPDHQSRGDIVIGHDVWFGANATVTSGVTIGSGAVIAANALVTKDVPPYAIVGGNPARVIRYRFADGIIARLLAIAWWDWPEPLLRERLPLMMASDIEAFLAVAESADTLP